MCAHRISPTPHTQKFERVSTSWRWQMMPARAQASGLRRTPSCSRSSSRTRGCTPWRLQGSELIDVNMCSAAPGGAQQVLGEVAVEWKCGDGAQRTAGFIGNQYCATPHPRLPPQTSWPSRERSEARAGGGVTRPLATIWDMTRPRMLKVNVHAPQEQLFDGSRGILTSCLVVEVVEKLREQHFFPGATLRAWGVTRPRTPFCARGLMRLGRARRHF